MRFCFPFESKKSLDIDLTSSELISIAALVGFAVKGNKSWTYDSVTKKNGERFLELYEKWRNHQIPIIE